MKKWYQSKTVWFNIITAALAVVSEVSNIFPMTSHPKVWVTVTTIGNLILRFLTTGALGAKKD